MSIEAMKLALAALETCRIRSVSEWSVEDITPKNVTAAIAALHTAIQQAEAQQPATGEPVKVAPYNPTEEMRLAMKRIDPALSSEQCRALWSAAWSATPEPVLDVRCEGCGYMTHHREHMGCVRAAKQHTHQAPSEPDEKPLPDLMMASYHEAIGWNACRAVMLAAAPAAHPAPSTPSLIEEAISSGHFGVLPMKATTLMCKAGWAASGGELTFQQIGHIYEEMYKARPLPDDAMLAAKEKP